MACLSGGGGSGGGGGSATKSRRRRAAAGSAIMFSATVVVMVAMTTPLTQAFLICPSLPVGTLHSGRRIVRPYGRRCAFGRDLKIEDLQYVS